MNFLFFFSQIREDAVAFLATIPDQIQQVSNGQYRCCVCKVSDKHFIFPWVWLNDAAAAINHVWQASHVRQMEETKIGFDLMTSYHLQQKNKQTREDGFYVLKAPIELTDDDLAAFLFKTSFDIKVTDVSSNKRAAFEIASTIHSWPKPVSAKWFMAQYDKDATRNIQLTGFASYNNFLKNLQSSFRYAVNVRPMDDAANIADPFNLDALVDNKGNVLSRIVGKGESIGFCVPSYFVSGFGSPFAGHNEDVDTGSVNVLLHGAPKFWYIVPPAHNQAVLNLANRKLLLLLFLLFKREKNEGLV